MPSSMTNAAAPPAEPASGKFERPRFVLPALIAFAVFLALVFWNGSPVSYLASAVFVLGCRYYELARYRAVHRSGLVLLLIVWKGYTVVWPIERFALLEQSPLLAIAAVLTLLALAVHLCVFQRRMREKLIANGQQDPDSACPDWPCGGLLAWFPPLFAWQVAEVVHQWPERSVVLGGLGVVLFVMQVRRHPLFPSLLLGWLLFGLVSDAGEWNAASTAWTVFMACLYLGYLAAAPRVRRTFQGKPS